MKVLFTEFEEEKAAAIVADETGEDFISVAQLDGTGDLNTMCHSCKRLWRIYDGCPGTAEKVWTGCIYREV